VGEPPGQPRLVSRRTQDLAGRVGREALWKGSIELLGSGGNRRMRPKGSVIRDSSQETRLMSDLLELRESGFAHEIEDDVMGARAMARMEHTGDKPVEASRGALSFLEIGEV